MKRLVVISDLHCGHQYGLVPPAWQKFDLQKKFWKWFADNAKRMGKINTLVVNGDAIDGKGQRSGGIELITSDRLEQVKMAEECIKQFDAEEIIIVAGTPYHAGNEEHHEQILADRVDGAFHTTVNVDVNGLIFNFKHKLGVSAVPHTRANAIMRAKFWNILHGAMQGADVADVVVRSHVHYYASVNDNRSTGVVTPCLQLSSAYGEMQSEGVADVGFVYFDVKDKEHWTLCPLLVKGELKKTPKIVR